MTNGICDKCKRKEMDTSEYGQHREYKLCGDCSKLWTKFHTSKEVARILDRAYHKPNWKEIWEATFKQFLGDKEKVQFT